MRILKEPLVHFLGAGCLLFASYSWLHRGWPALSRAAELLKGNQLGDKTYKVHAELGYRALSFDYEKNGLTRSRGHCAR